jgi:hypothetical protein
MTATADRMATLALVWSLIMAGVMLTATPSAAAGEITEKAAEAETLLQSGEAGPAFDALGTAVDAFWKVAPLTIREAYFLAAGDGDGRPIPRPDGPFRSGERARVLLEPLGYGFTEDSGIFRIALTTGIEIRTPGGLILAKSEDFGRLEWAGPGRNRNFTGRIGIDLPELKPGDYELLVTLGDQASQKTASVALPFSIGEN